MTFAGLMLAALCVAFPRTGAQLPSVSRCYLIGSVDPGVTNVTVQGHSFPVHPMGGWVAMADCEPGDNEIAVSCECNGSVFETNLTVTVARPAPVSKAFAAVAPKQYEKLPYAGDAPSTNRTRVIVLDAGHGGSDTGALSPHGLPEKDANLRMAKAVRAALQVRGFTVVMTREDDSFPPLYDRPKVAHACNAEAFVSIHHNAPPVDRDPRAFRYHAVFAWNPLGEELARAINLKMDTVLGPAIRNNGVPHANFAVTRNPEIPSCLVEVDFVTTPESELDCWNPRRRRRVAESIADGIAAWSASR